MSSLSVLESDSDWVVCTVRIDVVTMTESWFVLRFVCERERERKRGGRERRKR